MTITAISSDAAIGKTCNTVLLHDVLFVPSLDVNLISCSALCKEGYKIHFIHEGCLVMRDCHTTMSSQIIYGLFRVSVISCGTGTASSAVAMTASSREVEKTIVKVIWHQRLGHAKTQSVQKLLRSNAVQPFRTKPKRSTVSFPNCVRGKQSRVIRHVNPVHAAMVGETIHSDICGPMSCIFLGRSRYYVSFVDEFSGYISIYPIARKSDVADSFKHFVVWLERKAECKIKLLQSDGGGEYVALNKYLTENGIETRRTTTYSTKENETAERVNRTIMESTRAMLSQAGLPRTFWTEAAVHAADIRNHLFCPRRGTVTSFELLVGRKPRVDHFRIFGCLAWVCVPKEKRQKVDMKTRDGVVIRYQENSQYKVWIKDSESAFYPRDVMIDERSFLGRRWFADDTTLTANNSAQPPPRAKTVTPPQNVPRPVPQQEAVDGQQNTVQGSSREHEMRQEASQPDQNSE